MSQEPVTVPPFDPTQPCDMERLMRGEIGRGWSGVPTMCMRCKNPHHACDRTTPLSPEDLDGVDSPAEAPRWQCPSCGLSFAGDHECTDGVLASQNVSREGGNK